MVSKTLTIIFAFIILGTAGYIYQINQDIEIHIVKTHEPVSVGNYVLNYLGDYKLMINNNVYELTPIGTDLFDLPPYRVEIHTKSKTGISIHVIKME